MFSSMISANDDLVLFFETCCAIGENGVKISKSEE